MSVTLHRGDALAVLRTLPDASVDAVVTDPPYGLAEHKPATIAQAVAAWTTGDREHVPDGRGFMGRRWDGFVPPPAVWDECLRVLKPGGHLLVFAGTRTVDLMGLSVRLAGFEIRDSIMWLYGSGMPKSLNVAKAIDKAAGAEREVLATGKAVKRLIPGADQARTGSWIKDNGREFVPTVTAPATDEAARWQGWGTGLKPASEPVIVARKPLSGTVAATVLAHGTGALNIDGCRVGDGGQLKWASPRGMGSEHSFADDAWTQAQGRPHAEANASTVGRWPANVVLDEHAAAALDAATAGTRAAKPAKSGSAGKAGAIYNAPAGSEPVDYGDTGGASRFFYCAKASTKERPKVGGVAHPTVKPLALVRWLVRLVTPPGGVVLDMFAGSGTTGQAADLEGFDALLVEREESYWPLIRARLGDALTEASDPVLAAVSAAGSRAELVEVWTRHEVVWTEEYTAAARARLAELEVAS